MALERVGIKLEAEGAQAFQRDTENSQRALKGFVSEARGSEGPISAFGQVAIGALRKVGEVAVEALGMGARAVAGFVTSSVGLAGEYEATLNRFSAVTGSAMADSGMSISKFDSLFLEMGAQTQYSAAAAAEAAVNLAKGGLTPAAIAAGGLEAALTLAAAGELELATASEILAKQLGVWAADGVTAAQVADRLSQAANASTVDVDELGLGLANVGGIARVAGAGFDETVTALAFLAPGFSSAADAGTSLKTFFQRLIPVTGNQTQAMAELGLLTEEGASKFYDATGAFIGVEAAMQLLQESTSGLTNEQKQLALQTIFGSDALRAAAMFAEGGAEGFLGMAGAMTDAGTATEAAAERNKGYAFAMESLGGSVETLKLLIGQRLLPTITDFIQTALIPGVNALGDMATALFEAENPAMALANIIVTRFPEAGGFIVKMFMAVQSLKDAWAEYGPVVMAAVQSAIQVIMAMAGHIQTIVTLFIAHWPQIRATVETVMQAVGTVISAVMASIGPIIATMVQTVRDNADSFAMIWQGLTGIIRAAAGIIGAIVVVLVGVIIGLFQGITQALDPIIDTIARVSNRLSLMLSGIVDLFRAAFDWIVGLFTGNFTLMEDATNRMKAAVEQIFWNLAAGVQEIISGFILAALLFIDGFVRGVIEFFINLYNQLVGHSIIPDMVNGIIQWFRDLGQRGIALISQMVLDIVVWVTQLKDRAIALIGLLRQLAIEGFLALVTNLVLKAIELKDKVLEQFNLLRTLAVVAFTLAREKLLEIIADLVLKILTKAIELKNEFLTTIKNLWAEMRDRFIEAVGRFAGLAGDIGSGIISGIVSAIQNGGQAIIDALLGAIGGAIEAAKRFLQIGSPSKLLRLEVGRPIVQGAVEGLDDGTKSMATAMTRLFSASMAPALSSYSQSQPVTPACNPFQLASRAKSQSITDARSVHFSANYGAAPPAFLDRSDLLWVMGSAW